VSPPDVTQAPSRGPRALVLARAALTAGVREKPPGSNTGPDVRRYLAPCVRHGKRLGLTAGAWCAAFASWCVWEAAHERLREDLRDLAVLAEAWDAHEYIESMSDAPIGYRASVAELYRDAVATGAWRDVQAGEAPQVGDLLVMRRGIGDPRTGGEGHVAIVDEESGLGGWWAIGGNEGDAVRRTLRRFGDTEEPIVGWIVLG
jgi:hypothetical protein